MYDIMFLPVLNEEKNMAVSKSSMVSWIVENKLKINHTLLPTREIIVEIIPSNFLDTMNI